MRSAASRLSNWRSRRRSTEYRRRAASAAGPRARVPRHVWGDCTGTFLQCNECPFVSAKEGSNWGDARYSVRLIKGTDDEEGGRRLNTMYTLHWMLDGDPFYVKITR
ncbi:hypothetical protein [Streptomyces sp. E2N166]|uniref:NucA/NucB deoxyribonuclease domain-containing protein n=1 Tax=Streptomyces sp. E2N166 TaxID=1851909 RepID=UPI001EE78669|nr:hypothetical protein [Streptomyces sp. E2N166]